MFPRNLTGRRKWGVQGKLVGATQPPPPTPCTPTAARPPLPHRPHPHRSLGDSWTAAWKSLWTQIHRADVLGPHAGLYPWLSLILSELQVGLKDGHHLTSPAGLLAVPLCKAFQVPISHLLCASSETLENPKTWTAELKPVTWPALWGDNSGAPSAPSLRPVKLVPAWPVFKRLELCPRDELNSTLWILWNCAFS